MLARMLLQRGLSVDPARSETSLNSKLKFRAGLTKLQQLGLAQEKSNHSDSTTGQDIIHR